MKMAKLLPTKRAKAEISNKDCLHPALFSYHSEKNFPKAKKIMGAVMKVSEPINHLTGASGVSLRNENPAIAFANMRGRRKIKSRRLQV
jgi:hypothetical protein